MLRLATLCAGRRLNESAKLVSAPDDFDRFDDLRREIAALPDDAPYATWAKWFLSTDPARPIVLYATGMPNHMPGEDQLVEGIADLLGEMKSSGPPQLLVRVYAKDRSGRFEPLKRRRPDILFPAVPWEVNWLTPLPADLPFWTNTLRHSALGINVASTVSLELCMFDKPVINVGYNPPSVPEGELSYARYYRFDHYAPVVASGAVRLAKSPPRSGRPHRQRPCWLAPSPRPSPDSSACTLCQLMNGPSLHPSG